MILLHRALHKDSRTSRFAILRISTEFQSLQLEITKESLRHYSTESRPIQITPWVFDSSQLEALGRVREGEAVVDRPNPGEGGGVWELHGFKAHHRMVLGCGEGLGGGGSTE